MASIGGYVFSLQGILKILNIVFGIICVGCIGGKQVYDDTSKSELYFVVVVCACLVASVLFYPVFLLSSSLDNNRGIKILDFIYHIIMGLVLIVASSLLLKSSVELNKGIWGSFIPTPGQIHFDKKVSAGAFGIINALVYFAASVFVITSKNEDQFAMSTKYSRG